MKSRKPTSIRLPENLWLWVRDRALRNERSFSGELTLMIRIVKEDVEKKERLEKPILKT
jgi:hypothetical protein